MAASDDKERREAWGRHLHAIRESYGESLRAFSKRTGLSHSWIAKSEVAAVSVPKRSTIVKLAETLHRPVGPMLAAAGYIGSPTDDDPADVALRAIFNSLTPKQKQERVTETATGWGLGRPALRRASPRTPPPGRRCPSTPMRHTSQPCR